jgi:hypothetical protein
MSRLDEAAGFRNAAAASVGGSAARSAADQADARGAASAQEAGLAADALLVDREVGPGRPRLRKRARNREDEVRNGRGEQSATSQHPNIRADISVLAQQSLNNRSSSHSYPGAARRFTCRSQADFA